MLGASLSRIAALGLLAIAATWLAPAASAQVGFTVDEISDPVTGESVPVFLWYPTEEMARTVEIGPFTFSARRDAAPAPARAVVVMSHGAEASGLSHFDTAVALAQAGYLVAAPTHARDNFRDHSATGQAETLRGRAVTISAILDRIGAQHAFPLPNRVAVAIIGFSQGGATALALGGAALETGRGTRHCAAHPDDGLCAYDLEVREERLELGDPRVAALVLLAPNTVYFEDTDLAQVRLPILLWRADADRLLAHPYHADRVALTAPNVVAYEVAENAGHGAFLAPFPDEVEQTLPPLLASPAGFDRARFHAERLNPGIIAFLGAHLGD